MAFSNAMIAAPAADVTNYATLFSTDASTTALISTILVCNTSATNVVYRIGLDTTAGTPAVANGEFLVFDATLAANDTVTLTIGLVVMPTQFIRVSAGSTAINFIASISSESV